MKIHFIINSRSCRISAETAMRRIRENFSGHRYHIARTTYSGHAKRLAGQAVLAGCDALVAVGGDGTVHEVANGSRVARIPIGIIPTGTANDLATRLGIPSDFDDACAIIRDGRVRSLDAMTVNGRYVLTTCGVGFPSAVIAAARKIIDSAAATWLTGGRLRRRAYAIGAGLALLRRLPQATVWMRCDGKWRQLHSMSLIIGLQPNLGTYFVALPHLKPSSMTMAGYSIDSGGRARMLRHVLKAVHGNQFTLADGRLFHARHITMESPTPVSFFADGELLAPDTCFEIEYVPDALSVYAPDAGRFRS